MRAPLRLLAVAAFFTLATTTAAAAQSGTIRGTVTDTATGPVVGAVVTVDQSALLTQTNTRGAYEFRGVPAGSHTIRVRALGHTPATQTVNVEATGVATADFTIGSNAIELARVEVVAGSRARHQAADELAVPVDVYTTEQIQQQGSTETGRILAALSPSVNMPHQSVTDANDIVQPFTLRGLSPDHTLVLINGWRQHQTALVNTFPYGSGAGSSGVDLNAIPSGAIDRIEVLRDGDAADYGSDAIAGVVNIKMKEGQFSPFLNVEGGRYYTANYPHDGTGVDINSGIGLKLGRGSLTLFGEFKHDDPTNRAWPDKFLADANGITDQIDTLTGKIIHKNNSIKQPNYHWGDGELRNGQLFANLRMPLTQSGNTELYAFGGFSDHFGTGNGFWRYLDGNRNWPQIYPQGFLPEFDPTSKDYSATAGIRTAVGGWALDFGGSYGLNTFDYNLRNTLNPSLGPCLDVACAPGPDGILGTADDPGIPNQTTFFAGRLRRSEYELGINGSKPYEVGLPAPLNVAAGVLFRGEDYAITQGELASYVNGAYPAQDGSGPAPAGSSVFGGFRPQDASDHSRTNIGTYLDLETNLTPQFLANVAGRFEHYSDFGSNVSGKLALRYQPAKQFVIRGSLSNGFRAPGLSQSYFSHITTSFIGGQLFEVGNFPVNARAAQIFGAKPLTEEKSVNISTGIAYTPVENFTITLDYFHIKLTNRILLGATFADSVSQAILADSGVTGIAGVQFFTNGLDTKTDGIDATANYRMPVGSGTLDLNLGANYTRNRITRVDPLPAVLQGKPTEITSILDLVTTLAIEKERPDWRGTLTGQYSISRFHALARASYYGGFDSAEPSFTDGEHYGGKTLVDTEIGYRFNQVNLSIGARNLFDVYPDQAHKEFNNNDNTFPWAAASPFGYNGRYLYTRAEIALGW
ncbi:MAG: TonB-dependent receptor [Gemmatimonadaceae bacterium]|nr:TonB-dependent receptor [Gemmatimonadaceae bacterium]